ncbi:insulinase family protein [Anoxybacillus flavithermus]|nr:pitrilysin family protein [Anoxybacillus flavithermus]MBE2922823.1 insulinase family protein [Anoxybacillus flavithermus]
MHILNEYLNEALCILRDMVFSFSISNFDFENEKRVVIQEIYQYQDNTLEKVKIASLAHALGESSYAFDILGTVSNIESFTLTEVYEFYRKFYLSNNTVVSISGDVKEDMLHDIVKILENIGFGKTVDKKTQPIMFNGGINYIPIHSQEYQSHMCILFPAISSDVPMREYYTYYIMSHLFGVGRNSRLNKVLREERGLVYNIQSHPIVFEEVGLFRILASTGKENLWDVHSAIMEVIESVKEVGITLDEFNRSKRVLKSEIIFLTENTIQRMFFFGQEELLGIHKSSDVDKILETIDAIDVWEVENTLKGIFDDIYSLTVTIPPSASV